jgi:NADH-quinone oxidoreductase subunit M
MGLLTILLVMPLLSAVFVMCLPEQFGKTIKGVSIALTGLIFLVSLGLVGIFENGTYHFQLVEQASWIPQIGASYKVGVDGISFWMVLLTTLLTFLSTIFSVYIKERIKAYFVMILLLETAMLGVFLSLDLLLFYTFFEFSLIPMALMIAIWGGENRRAAALKFFVYTFAASIFMLVAMIWMRNLNGAASGEFTFDIVAIQRNVANGTFWATAMQLQPVLFWAFAIAFMVKTPMFPFHTWLPHAHTEAPTAGSIILAGVLLKMGTYGVLRFLMPLFPEALQQSIPILMTLSVAGIIYGAVVAAMQDDVKKLVAYSSVAHMGFVMLGLLSLSHTGIMGGAYQQINHGVSTGALFLLIGLIYERIHTRKFSDMGGLKAQMPIFAAMFLIVMLSSVGLPGLNGFVGEFLALMGAFQTGFAGQFGLSPIFPILAGTGVILAAVYLLWMFQKVFYGPITNPMLKRLKDLKEWEIGLVGVFVILIFWGGLYPNTFLKPMERSLNAARMMAVMPEGRRPVWADPTLDISSSGDLVRVARPYDGGEFSDLEIIETVTPANFAFETKLEPGPEVAELKEKLLNSRKVAPRRMENMPNPSAAAAAGG